MKWISSLSLSLSLSLLVGMSIYFFYGLRHSVEGKRGREEGDYIPLDQVESHEDDKGTDEGDKNE